VQTATTAWLSPDRGSDYHAVLQDEPGDRRTEIMALALRDGFGSRFEPLLILPDLLNEVEARGERSVPAVAATRRSQLTVLSEIWTHGHLSQLRLYGLALPASADPEGSWAVPTGIVTSALHDRIERLRTFIVADAGPDAVETEVVEATPDLPVFGTLYDNSVCNQIVLRLVRRLREQGWSSDVEILSRTIGTILATWNKRGISPILPLRADDLDAMTRVVHAKLL
jgi:hypothetical protein